MFGLVLTLFVVACGDDTPIIDPMDEDLTEIPYNPTDFEVNLPIKFPKLEIPNDNPLTIEGIDLGRHLFYDPILSVDSTMSCSSCHLPAGSFTDNRRVSLGVTGETGRRSSMSLLNIGLYYNGFFWDGRSDVLEEQALLPIEDPIELHDTWPNVEKKLRRQPLYQEKFRRAFGIERSSEITKELAGKAITQFERTLVSSGNSKYDKIQAGQAIYTEQELMGFDMFFDLNPFLPDAECGHCHNAPLFTTNEYINNGLDPVESLMDFADFGRGEVTGKLIDNGTFRVPTLRNIQFTAPYMHDGRFQTLREVINHYNSGGFHADNTNPLIRPLGLTEDQIDALISFINTLSDPDFVNNPTYSNPFE
jgi:cytochrome c peroxidase